MEKYKSIAYLSDKTKDIELVICNHSLLSYPVHNHISVYTIGLIIDGTVQVVINSDLQYYKKGDIFAIPPYVPHSIKAVKAYSMISLCIHKEFIEAVGVVSIKTRIAKMLNHATETDNADLNEMLNQVTEFDSINLKERYQQKILQILHKIISDKNELKKNELKKTTIYSPMTAEIYSVCKQLESAPEKKISVGEMAQSAFISKYQFIRNFKQEVGLTPHQFQIQNRIRKAQKLLGQTEKLTEVAFATGFCDQSHFIRHFEKIVGLTPSGYVLSCNTLKTD